MRENRFNIALLLVLFLGLSLVAGPGQVRAEELRIVAPWAAKGLEPARSGYIFCRMGCLETLVTVDETGSLAGQLAKSWSVADDKLTWTFVLRSGVKFHDGQPMTAETVAAALNRQIARKGLLSRTPVSSVKAQGADKLVIVTETPFSPLPAFLCHYSQSIFSPASLNDKDEVTKIIGTGGYKMVSHEAGKIFGFERFDDYWGAKPKIAKSSYYAVPKGDARGFMVQAGQAELAYTLSPVDAEKINRTDQAKAVVMTIPRTRLIKMDCGSIFFNDIRVRRAISLAINRPAIAKAILRNPDSAATQLLPPGQAMWYDIKLPKLAYNPKKAAELLDKAGWKLGSDGIRVKDGKQFKVELVTYASRPMLPLVAEAVQAMLKKVGVVIDITVGQYSLLENRHKDGSLQMGLLARNFNQIPDPVGNLFTDFGPKPGTSGAMNWKSDKMVELLTAYQSSFSEPEAAKYRREIIGLIQEELPVIPVTWYENVIGYSNKIKDVSFDPMEISYRLAPVQWVD